MNTLESPSAPNPEYCPNPDCPNHDPKAASSARWFSRFGSFTSKAWGITPRFICKDCGKTCSINTFSINYWVQSRVDISDLVNRFNSRVSLRQIGRDLNLSYAVIKNRSLRLTRSLQSRDIFKEQAV